MIWYLGASPASTLGSLKIIPLKIFEDYANDCRLQEFTERGGDTKPASWRFPMVIFRVSFKMICAPLPPAVPFISREVRRGLPGPGGTRGAAAPGARTRLRRR